MSISNQIITDKTFEEFMYCLLNNREDFINLEDDMSEDIALSLREKGIHNFGLIPVSNPKEGNFGYCIFWNNEKDKNNSEHSYYISNKIWPTPEKIICKTIEEFKNAYNEAIKNDWFMTLCPDPKLLLMGFLVVRGSRTISYSITFNGLKNYTCQEPNKNSL